jgi:hypothetical protein
VLTLLLGPALAADGVDMPGSDYAHFPAPTAGTCRATCGGESRCQAYTWVKPGIQGPSGQCWLKDKVPVSVRSNCCESSARGLITRRDLLDEDLVDRPGFTHKGFPAPDWQACETACIRDGICKSWSWTRPGAQGPRSAAQCALKNAVGRPVLNNNTISGVKYAPASVRID